MVAQLGIFYGGQIQQRQELPLVFDRAKQTQGFRLTFPHPLEHDARVSWEVEMPGESRLAVDPLSVSKLGELTVRVGQRRVDQALEFEPGDPAGLWNVRVLVDDRLVVDHAWWVYDRARRQRAIEKKRAKLSGADTR